MANSEAFADGPPAVNEDAWDELAAAELAAEAAKVRDADNQRDLLKNTEAARNVGGVLIRALNQL